MRASYSGLTLESPLPARLSPAFRGRPPAIPNTADCPKLPSHVKGSVDFGVGDPRATSLAKLSIGLYGDQGFRVEFRKVPLESN